MATKMYQKSAQNIVLKSCTWKKQKKLCTTEKCTRKNTHTKKELEEPTSKKNALGKKRTQKNTQ